MDMNAQEISRRNLLVGAAAFALSGSEAWAQAPARYALKIPPMVSPSGLVLTCAPGTASIGGRTTAGLFYNGLFPGPTIVARKGGSASIRLVNNLSAETITHWHGMIVDHMNDGHPHSVIAPGSHYDYQFPIVQRAAMNWYHPHPHMMTGQQVALGLAGAFLVRDAEEDALGLPSGKYEIPLVIKDVAFDSAGNLAYKARSSGFLGTTFMVNGTLNPRLRVDRGVYRLRILNGSNARVYELGLTNGAAFTIIGNDGGLLPATRAAQSIRISPGERLDLLVDFTDLAAGGSFYLRCKDAKWNLLQFVGTGNLGVSYALPSVLSKVPRLSGPSTPKRTFSFDGMSRINGNTYDVNRIEFRVPFGVVERWRFTTGGNAPHPVHVHGASFQVVARSGGRGTVYPWERGWKDTVLLEDGESVDVLIRFDGYRGLYVMHCHKLEHEDMGMMSNFEVV